MENLSQTSPWNVYQKFAFRFVFIFFILFIVCLDWSVNSILSNFYYNGNLAEFLDSVISWTGKQLFHIQYTIISPYDGQHNDRVYIYLLYFIMVVMGVLGAIIWSVLDRKRTNYQTLYYWLTVFVRYYLAFTLFMFALEKFFKIQFPDLGYYTLTEPLGDMSPMSLAWAFYGYSYGYNVFMGLAESAALFLLFRRTTALGALLTMATLANVMAVNFNYDVHAKMYPTALFLMAFFLLLKDLKRLMQFFFTGQAISLPVIKAPVFKKRWMNISKIVLKVLVIGYFTILPVMDYFGFKKNSEERGKAKSQISGVYDVDTFVTNKDTLSNDNPLRWKQIVIGDKMVEAVRFKDDSIAFLYVSVNKKEIIVSGDQTDLQTKMQEIYNEQGMGIYPQMDSILIARQIENSLRFEFPDSTTLKLKGMIKNDSVFITAKRKPFDIKNFRLMKRRFHWITEAAYLH
ncbi:MAG: hypothetical protein WBB06_07465 [Chitinophagaceae bacterium]